MRWLLGILGGAVATYGGWLLLSNQDRPALVEAAVWLAAGVVLHDLVLAPLVMLLAWVAGRLLPRPALGPAAVGLVVLGSVTLVAIPVLGRFGAIPSDPTLLDRNYLAGWLTVAGLTLLAVVAAAFVVRSRSRRTDAPGARG